MSVFTNPPNRARDTAAAYIAGILELLGERDPLAVLRGTAAELRRLLEGVDDARLRRPEAPGKWSAVEVVQHLADAEAAWAWRLRCTLAQDRPELTGYDQDAWVARLGYREVPIEQALDQFEILRRTHLWLFDRLQPADFKRVGVHRERGDETVEHMIRLFAGHDLVHLRQLRRVLAG